MRDKYLWMLSAGHMVTDINQGALPAMLPFLASAYSLTYRETAGIIFAGTVLSSIVQPLFGVLADKTGISWIMSAGVFLAGAGVAAIGFSESYWAVFWAAMVSGIGIAAFHPEAARWANAISGNKKGSGISIFAVGGNLGFALGPVLVLFAMSMWGMAGSLLFLVPVSLMAFILLISQKNLRAISLSQKKKSGTPADAKNRWGSFSVLTVSIVSRSVIFYGLNTFIPLYWIHTLGATGEEGNLSLTLMFTVGAVATLIGGKLADRFGYTNMMRIGFGCLAPLLAVFPFIESARWAQCCLVPIAFSVFTVYSPMVVLGQKFLPRWVGLASGVTLGLASSVGGVAAPALGQLADVHGLSAAMCVLPVVAAVALLGALFLKDPTDTETK